MPVLILTAAHFADNTHESFAGIKIVQFRLLKVVTLSSLPDELPDLAVTRTHIIQLGGGLDDGCHGRSLVEHITLQASILVCQDRPLCLFEGSTPVLRVLNYF